MTETAEAPHAAEPDSTDAEPTDAEPTDAEPTEEPSRRSSRGMRDMALSMVVLLIPLALVVLLFRARGGEDAVVIDPAPTIAQAQQSGTFTVAVPTDLAEGWRTVSATFVEGADGATLRLGYLTPGGGAIQLIESSEAVDPLLIRELGDNVRPVATVDAGAVSWDSYRARGSERAIVRKDAGRTMIVIGAAPLTDLQDLAESLE